MKEYPILFSGDMVCAILDGRKVQTRRIAKSLNDPFIEEVVPNHRWPKSNWKQFLARHSYNEDPPRYEVLQMLNCPYGQNGDQLWVRETWAIPDQNAGGYGQSVVSFRADSSTKLVSTGFGPSRFANMPEFIQPSNWKPSIFMPKWASRILLEITSVRVERLNDISEVDAISEGVMTLSNRCVFDRFSDYETRYLAWERNGSAGKPPTGLSPKERYESLWTKINGPESWNENPWVWVVEFNKL